MIIENGWITNVNKRQTPNITRGHQSRELIVMHYTASYTTASALNTLCNPAAKASAHFVVGTDGAIWQLASTQDTCWHAGSSQFGGKGAVNARSIGIEIVNPGYHFKSADGQILNWRKKPVSAAQLASFPDMLEARDPWVGSKPAFWPHYPAAQLAAIEQLTKALKARYPSLAHVKGHRDVDIIRRLKVDPGPAFPMARFQALIA